MNTPSSGIILEHMWQNGYDELQELWSLREFPESEIENKNHEFRKLVIQSVVNAAADEEALLNDAKQQIAAYKSDIDHLGAELQMHPPIMESGITRSILKARLAYKAVRDEMTKEKAKRTEIYDNLCDQWAAVCAQLDQSMDLPPVANPLSCVHLDMLKTRVEESQLELKKRKTTYAAWQAEIATFVSALAYTAERTVERSLLNDKLPNTYGTRDMEAMSGLLCKLKIRYDAYVEKMEAELQQNLSPLLEIWDACHVAQLERNLFLDSLPNKYSAEAKRLIKLEVQRLQYYHEERRNILTKVDEWMSLWEQKVELENRADDPTRFLNRGGRLLQEERQKKKIERDLTQVRREIEKAVDDWNASRPGQPIFLDGQLVTSRLDQMEQQYAEEKEQMRKEKKANKGSLLETELIHGPQKPSATNKPFKTRGP